MLLLPIGDSLATVETPFVYEEPLGGGQLIDREQELETLCRRALAGRNSRIEAPRRYGKTSLVRALLAAADREGAVGIEVDFLGCVTREEVAERIERAYRAQLDGGLKRWLDAFLAAARPTLSAAPGGIGVGAAPQRARASLLELLDLPARVHERSGRVCVIAFDEFQELFRIDPALPGVFRSQLERHGDAAGYVFSGSHPGLMRELFSDRRHAFFGQAAPTALGPLPPLALADAVAERFEQHGRDAGEGVGPLLEVSEGHPQRAMLLAHHLFAQTRRRATADVMTWQRALAAARTEAAGEIGVLWDACSELERRILKAVAFRTFALGSRDAAERFGLVKGGSTRLAVARLVREGTLVADATTRSGYRVVDPLLAGWLRGD